MIYCTIFPFLLVHCTILKLCLQTFLIPRNSRKLCYDDCDNRFSLFFVRCKAVQWTKIGKNSSMNIFTNWWKKFFVKLIFIPVIHKNFVKLWLIARLFQRLKSTYFEIFVFTLHGNKFRNTLILAFEAKSSYTFFGF